MSEPWPYRSYSDVFTERINRFNKLKDNTVLQIGAKEYYKDKPAEYINDWSITYDPRNASKNIPPLMPFVLFPRQVDLIDYLYSCYLDGESGLIEKARDMGATWICCAFSIWLFLFAPGAAIGWGSRKEQLVDKIGDPDSIFEKLRMILSYTPKFFLPDGFTIDRHCSYMKIIHPGSSATITGEAGDNIGRGGRKTIYFKDESAHYERPEKIEAALGDNTDVQIDFSSVNGTGNIFHRRRLQGEIWDKDTDIPDGVTRVFILDWCDHPLKTQGWYDKRKEKAEREGLINIFNQEVDRDYTGSVEGVLIPGMWVKSAIDAHIKLGFEAEGKEFAALDPADEGRDAHAFMAHKGSIITFADQWHKGDTGDATRKSIRYCTELKIKSFQFDGIGVGAGVKSECNRMKVEKRIPNNLHIQRWMSSATVLNPFANIIIGDKDSPINKDFYKNLKAQAYWQLRLRFYRTHRAITKGEEYDSSELISIPSGLEYRAQLENELSQSTYTHDSSGKIIVDKNPPGTKSPNLADSCTMMFWPADKLPIGGIVGGPSGFKAPKKEY